ncbi:hypothetical protein GCM10027284_09460 [Cyclobacterium sediminis]
MEKANVYQWLKAGAPLSEGLRLFAEVAGERHPFTSLIRHNHQVAYPILIRELAFRSGISLSEVRRIRQEKGTFRENWPFLSDPACPPELKVLAADKITAYWSYVRAHEQLFDCVSREEQLATVKMLMDNYKENKAIIAEFVHYKEHGIVLGKHSVFKEMKALEKLRELGPIDLIKMEERLEHNLWRIENELKKNRKPHLRAERERRIRIKKRQLEEVRRLIKQFK